MLVLSNLVNIIMSVVIMQYIFSIILQFTRTKNVPWHILAPAAVACDIYIVRRSAHPRGAFLCNRNEVSYYIKNKAYENFSVCPGICFYYSRLSLNFFISALSLSDIMTLLCDS